MSEEIKDTADRLRGLVKNAATPGLLADSDRYRAQSRDLITGFLEQYFNAERAAELGRDDERLLRHAHVAQDISRVDRITLQYMCIDLMRLVGDEFVARHGSWQAAFEKMEAGQPMWLAGCTDPDCTEHQLMDSLNEAMKETGS